MPRIRTLLALALALTVISAFAPKALAQAQTQVQVQAAPVLDLPPDFRQGEALLAVVRSPSSLAELSGELRSSTGKVLDRCQAFELPPAGETRRYGLAFALDMDASPGTLTVVASGLCLPPASEEKATAGDLFSIEGSVKLEKRAYFSETLRLDQANTDIRTQPDPKKVAEAEALYALLGTVDAQAVFDPSTYIYPVNPATRRSSGFGDRRVYVYTKGGSEASVHAGVDLAVVVDTPVQSCAAGKVVFAAPRIVTGNTIIVEHLPGLYSLYMHLSRIEVEAGQAVDAGAELGRSGSTGLSTGPHLHFELRLRGRAVDPEAWLRRSGR